MQQAEKPKTACPGEVAAVNRAAWLLGAIWALGPVASSAQSPSTETIGFLAEEARVVTASLSPERASRAPATVYVVTAEDIRASGAQTLWDALRMVPGVDAMTVDTMQGAVIIRGLNRAGNNRVLVLLDGRTVLDNFYDTVNWEAIPVTLEEIDRIEIMEGPGSVLYGSNAVSGVINIITKAGAQLKGGLVSYTGAERNTHLAAALYGDRRGKLDYRLGTGLHSADSFADAGRLAGKTGKFNAALGYDFSKESRLDVSGGGSNGTRQTASSFQDSSFGFARLDYRFRDTRLRTFWNTQLVESRSGVTTAYERGNTYDLNIQQGLAPHADHRLTAGASLRRNENSSDLLSPGTPGENLLGFFLEEQWRPREGWTFWVGARVDKHPLTDWLLSPRGSMVWEFRERQSLRFSVGKAFRNPTILESYLETDLTVPPSPGYPFSIRLISSNNRDLSPEQMLFFELAYAARLDRLKVQAEAFHYRLSDQIVGAVSIGSLGGAPPTLPVTLRPMNGGETRAYGGELAAEFAAGPWAKLFANYSIQELKDDRASLLNDRSSPENKINAGARFRRAGLSASCQADWVDRTFWRQNDVLSSTVVMAKTPAYWTINARLGYSFPGRWEGLEAAVSVLNPFLPARVEILREQGGEAIGSRLSATLSYRF
ncbi:MAG: TonB-dependent receptor [Elusimicrobia bacterium]|nr:TonB-dependent receptor [Elusimicrobiota bacterium]